MFSSQLTLEALLVVVFALSLIYLLFSLVKDHFSFYEENRLSSNTYTALKRNEAILVPLLVANPQRYSFKSFDFEEHVKGVRDCNFAIENNGRNTTLAQSYSLERIDVLHKDLQLPCGSNECNYVCGEVVSK